MFQKTKTNYFNSPINKPLIGIDYLSKNIEEYFHLCNPEKNNLSEKYTTQDVTNAMKSIVKHVNPMEKGMIGLQDNSI